MSDYSSNIALQYEVFKSPENFLHSFGEGAEIHIPVPPTPLQSCEFLEERAIPSQLEVYRHLTLRRRRCSLHITNDLLDQYLNFKGYSPREARSEVFNAHQACIIAFMRKTAEATYQKLKEETWDNIHNTLLDSVKVIWQLDADRILVDIVVYSCRQREVELAKEYFQRVLLYSLQNSITFPGTIDNVRIEDRQLAPKDLEAAHRLWQ